MAVVAGAVPSAKAGFWIRVVAYIIDTLAIFVVGFMVGLVLGLATAGGGDTTGATNLATGLVYLLSIVYFIYFWSGSGGGRTPGMRVLGLKVVRTDGSDLTVTQAVIRVVGIFVASLPLGLGLLWVAFDKDKQGWHDKIASTFVVKT